jgi:LPS export ABC transporter protein LptC
LRDGQTDRRTVVREESGHGVRGQNALSVGPAVRLSVWFFAGLLLSTACQDNGVRPTQTATAADSADQILEDMDFNMTTDGVRRTRVVAETAYVYEATQLARLKKVKVTFFDLNGVERSTVVGDSGLYQTRDGSMDAWGHVIGTTPDGKKLTTEQLRYDSRKHEISSTKYFQFDKPGQHLEGNGFTSDPEFANVRAGQPKGREVTGDSAGGFLLPGQNP